MNLWIIPLNFYKKKLYKRLIKITFLKLLPVKYGKWSCICIIYIYKKKND